MKYTVQTLLKKGFSQRAISRELGISRQTVKNYLSEIQKGIPLSTPKISRKKGLDDYFSDIREWYDQGLTGILILEKLKMEKQLNVSYSTIARFVKKFKYNEVYVPLIAKPGEEGQVDFGYLGKFVLNNKFVKVWCFSMVLSNSRYSFHCLVTDQSVGTFIECHIKAFNYFGGCPQTVKIDNLKAGVITPSFYEPVIQRQYAEFLEHYSCAPITARIRRGQDKGKVEAGVKYVKNNFLKRIEHKLFEQLENDLSIWSDTICNLRIHGTTKKIPKEVFDSTEKKELVALPDFPYVRLVVELRKVNNFAHVSFKNNYYSVPYNYAGKKVMLKITAILLKVYDDTTQIALHPICTKEGEYISKDEHRPPEKQRKAKDYYTQIATETGADTLQFLVLLQQQKPHHWHKVFKGIIQLKSVYGGIIINKACKRAVQYDITDYQAIKNICKNKNYDEPTASLAVHNTGGFYHPLLAYDNLCKN